MAFSTSLNDLLSRCGEESESESELLRPRSDRLPESDLRDDATLLADHERDAGERRRCLRRGEPRLGLALALSCSPSPRPP